MFLLLYPLRIISLFITYKEHRVYMKVHKVKKKAVGRIPTAFNNALKI
jgi:hypothetical protein